MLPGSKPLTFSFERLPASVFLCFHQQLPCSPDARRRRLLANLWLSPQLAAAMTSCLIFYPPSSLQGSGAIWRTVGEAGDWRAHYFQHHFFPHTLGFFALVPDFNMHPWSRSICPWIIQSCWCSDQRSLLTAVILSGWKSLSERTAFTLGGMWPCLLPEGRKLRRCHRHFFQPKKDYLLGNGTSCFPSSWLQSRGERHEMETERKKARHEDQFCFYIRVKRA